MDLSPIQVDHLIRGYAAGFGVMFLTATDALLVNAGNLPNKPAGYFGSPTSLLGMVASASGVNRFWRETTSKQSSVDFHEHAQFVTQVVGSIKGAMLAGEYEEAMRILEENPVPVAFKKAFARAKRASSKYTVAIRVLLSRSDISSEEKGREYKRLIRERTAIHQRMLKIYREAMDRAHREP